MRLWLLLTFLLVACGDETPVVAPIAPGTPSVPTQGAPPAPADPAAAPATGGETLSCKTPDGMCIQCVAGAPCYSPTMEASCRTRGEFSNDDCSLEGAIGRCLRPDTGVVVFYGGPPRNHRPDIMQQLCQNGFRGEFEAIE